MKSKLLLMIFLGGSLFAETRIAIGIGVGAPVYYPPPLIAYAPPPCPGPDYVWIPGYWYPVGPRYLWHSGYWTLPPYAGAYWVAPRYYERHYYRGYWAGSDWRRHRGFEDRWDRGWHGDYHHGRGHKKRWRH